MQRLLVALLAVATVFGLSFVVPAPRAQNVTAPPLIRIGGTARGLQPVALQSAKVHVDVAGRLARTTLTLTLHNPNDRVLEGTLEFPLAPGQQVSGFALDVGGEMREAVPVPKETGRQVFESIERRGVDPGLLEQTAGNNFRLRVYPIPARGTRQVRLAIDETLVEGNVRLPVQLLSGAEAFDLRVTAGGVGKPQATGVFDGVRFVARDGGWEATLQRNAFRASAPVGLRFPMARRKAAYVARMDDGERYVLGEVPVDATAYVRAIPGRVGLLWDASGSARRRDRAADFAVLDRYFRSMWTGTVQLRLLRDVGADGGTFTIRDGDWSALRGALEAAVLDGATDLADWTPRDDIREYLLFSDGQRNYGEAEFPRLHADQRLYAVAPSSGADTVRLATLAQQRNGRMVEAASPDALFTEHPRIVGLAAHGVTDLEVPSRFVDDGWLRVAGRATEPNAYVDVTIETGAGRRVVRVDMLATGTSHPQVASLWGAWKIAALSADPERNAARIARTGQQFGLVTAGTSLLVLEDPADYVRYDIPAPAALRDAVAAMRATQDADRRQHRTEHLDRVAGQFEQRIAWWEHKFPKDAPPRMIEQEKAERRTRGAAVGNAEPARELAAAPAPASAPAPAPASESELDAVMVEGVAVGATITLQPWQSDAPYARRLRDAKPADAYARYLDARDDHADSTAFHLDVADILLAKGRRDEALRVLSNLAEMQLESRHVLRVLGYRLMQAKDYARAVEVFGKVRAIADEEPQSHRDLGLALAAAGQRQAAIERLYEVVARPWDGRFPEVELVALNELNAIVATSPSPLDTSFVDRRLLRNLPVDLRVALGWDSDNSDMDLWVTDPNGEKCYYGHRLTWQGGQLSLDFTGGYGPEEFLLRDAKPGKYRVEANFFGDRQQVVTGATTLTLTLSTGWGTKARKDQVVTLRLTDKRETVLVGEFEVR